MRGSQREPATRCAPRLAALIMPPQTWSSPGSAQTCPSSCVTCASLEIFLTRTCWPAFDGQLRASVSALPQQRLAGPLLVAGHHRRHLRRAGPPHGAWVRAPCLRRQSHHVSPPWCLPWSTTSASPLASRTSQSWQSTTRALMLPSRALSRHFRRPRLSSHRDNLTKTLAEREFLWRNVLSGTEGAMQDLPTPSLRHARGITRDDCDRNDEHPLARKRLKTQALITTCVLLQMHEALEPASRCRDGAR